MNRYVAYSLIRLLLLILLIFFFFMVGLMIGYGVIGDGEPTAVFSGNLWTNVLKFMK